MPFIGRKEESNLIQKYIDSDKPELGIVYGRRRIGKSTLLKQFIRPKVDFYFEGLQRASGKKQLDHFMEQIARQTQSLRMLARDWNEAFQAFSGFIKKGKHYVVFDEFPWMAAGRTELVSLVKYYWDNVWKQNPHLTLVICGSVASFMVKHIVHSQALHNRKTFEIKLEPLPAYEAKLFFKPYRSDFEVLKFLTVFGGVPKYLEQIDPKKSISANIDELCMKRNCFFFNEYETLFKEQFKVIRYYGNIVGGLAKKSLSQEGLAKSLGKTSGGGLTLYVKNLERADFIKTLNPYSPSGDGGKTHRIYLWDEWLRFYFTYMKPYLPVIAKNTKAGLFDGIAAKSFDSYCGLAFERLCLKNLTTLLSHLDLDMTRVLGFGPFFRQAPRNKAERDTGLQIDILAELKGHVLLVMECKFSVNPIGLSVVREVERKLKLLRPPKTYSIEKILVAPGGVTTELEKARYFHHILGCEALLDMR